MTEFRSPALEKGEKILILTRRMFPTDHRRHFVGAVERLDAEILRARGYAYVYDTSKGGFVRRPNQQTRIFRLDNLLVIHVLPYETDVASVRYETGRERGLTVTDGKQFKLELSELNV